MVRSANRCAEFSKKYLILSNNLSEIIQFYCCWPYTGVHLNGIRSNYSVIVAKNTMKIVYRGGGTCGDWHSYACRQRSYENALYETVSALILLKFSLWHNFYRVTISCEQCDPAMACEYLQQINSRQFHWNPNAHREPKRKKKIKHNLKPILIRALDSLSCVPCRLGRNGSTRFNFGYSSDWHNERRQLILINFMLLFADKETP